MVSQCIFLLKKQKSCIFKRRKMVYGQILASNNNKNTFYRVNQAAFASIHAGLKLETIDHEAISIEPRVYAGFLRFKH